MDTRAGGGTGGGKGGLSPDQTKEVIRATVYRVFLAPESECRLDLHASPEVCT